MKHHKESEGKMLAVSNTIEELLGKKKLSKVHLAEALDMSKQNLGNKLRRNTFSPDELVHIAEFLEMKLAFIDADGNTYIIEASETEE